MKHGRQGDHLWRGGFFTGWDEFRYGSTPRKIEPIFKDEKREHIVQSMMDVMRDWRSSPFEREASTRAGIRSGLCLKGYEWSRADAEAASIVAECLNLLGAVRPSWEEGQREYSVAPENCSWCGCPVPDEYLVTQRKTRFCSDVCARAALTYRDYRVRAHSDAAYGDALDIINRSRNPVCKCQNCGKKFRPVHATNPAKYCSVACRDEARRVAPIIRACAQCGQDFEVQKGDQKFCSHECYWKAERPTIVKECEWCHNTFEARGGKAKYCSNTCRQTMIRMRNGTKIPKRISAPVLDYLFRRQGLRITSGVRLAA